MAQGRLRGVLQADGAPLVVWVRSGSVSDALGLVGQEIRVRGVPLRATAAARQRGESELFVDTLADLLLVNPPAVASTVITDAASIRRLSGFDTSLRHRVHLRGVVTYVDPAWRLVFVQDDTAGVFVNTEGMSLPFAAGDSVEVQRRHRHRRLRAVADRRDDAGARPPAAARRRRRRRSTRCAPAPSTRSWCR